MSTARQTLAIFWHFTKPYKWRFITCLALLPIGSLSVNTFTPKIFASAIDRLQVTAIQSGFWETFGDLFFVYICLISVSFLSWRLIGFTLSKMQLLVIRDMERAIFAKLIDHSYRFHADHFGGALVAQTNRMKGAYIRLFDTAYFDIGNTLLKLLSSIIVLAFIVPIAAVILSVWVVIFMITIGLMQKKKMHLSKLAAAADSKVTATLADTITNISNVKAFGRNGYENARFSSVSDHRFEISKKDWYINELIFGVQSLLMFIVEVLLIWVGIALALKGTITVGTLALTQIYFFIIIGSLWNFGRTVRNIETSLSDAAEMTEILMAEIEVADNKDTKISTIKNGEVTFTNVDFGYPEQNKNTNLFSNLNLAIPAGQKIGLAGPSGGGKTTITKLLLRFMDCNSGQIAIDGQDISVLSQADLRQSIAYVPQEPLLFHRSIRDNIAYGKLDASDDEIIAAAKKARAHDFIEKLEHGYDTLVGERGIKLSGGQKQRVAIARAMLKNAPILVLDEATSALDSESEKEIQAALWELMKDRTALVIAHRLSTIQKMDRILVLDEGKIIEEGTHTELIKKSSGLYHKLWQHQTGGFIGDK